MIAFLTLKTIYYGNIDHLLLLFNVKNNCLQTFIVNNILQMFPPSNVIKIASEAKY